MSRSTKKLPLQLAVPAGIFLEGLRRACDAHGYPARLTWKGKGHLAATAGPETDREALRHFVAGWVAGQGY